ncbi:hypothetical protein BGI30_08175 [Snodgrassella alvi]|jgi:type I restriction enzyme, S subunit|uniref:restriction endonuclease subunit S n=1 Tax=Snodgrassella alvi TaxID=1196083 RepID=UPI000C1E2A2D|nr:restriction endonuclease subunit S [Snodgrassella alvi]PIT09132.1 hypothetical protein BGI30_08175 [Snodgrassella alvi]PIT56723.1 hypothetical protein BHC59_07525 [Snodgrassella alvi]
MSQSKKLIPRRRFKEFENSQLWKQSYFLQVIINIIDFRGRTPKKLGMDWSECGFLALSALNVKNGYIDFSADAHYGDNNLYLKWMGGNELRKGQVIFTTEAPMGNVAQIPDDNGYILSQRTIAFEVNKLEITDDFLAILLKSPSVYNSLLMMTSGGTAKGISQKSLSTLKIHLSSSITEQTQIGEFFKKLDNLINTQQKKLEKAKTLKSAYLTEMFPNEGELKPRYRFLGFKKDWSITQFKNLANIRRGLTYTPSNLALDGVRVLRSSNIDSDRFILRNDDIFIDQSYVSISLVKENDILITSANGSSRLVGKHALIKITNNEKAVHGGFMLLATSNQPFFTNAIMSSNWYRKFLNTYVAGGNGAIGNLNKTELANQDISIPTTLEQTKIGNFFKLLDDKIALEQKKLDKLKNIKQAYLNEMFV